MYWLFGFIVWENEDMSPPNPRKGDLWHRGKRWHQWDGLYWQDRGTEMTASHGSEPLSPA